MIGLNAECERSDEGGKNQPKKLAKTNKLQFVGGGVVVFPLSVKLKNRKSDCNIIAIDIEWRRKKLGIRFAEKA